MNGENETTQAALALAYFRKGETLTQNEALSMFGIGRLAHIKYVLNKMGHNIQCRRKRVQTAHGHFANIGEYYLDLKQPMIDSLKDRKADRV